MTEEFDEIGTLHTIDDYKKLVKHSILSVLFYFSPYFFSIFNSFFLARLLTRESWGFLILATSFITIIITLLRLLPPGLNKTLNYFLPRFLALNQRTKIKSYIKNAIIQKVLFLVPTFVISITIFYLFTDLLRINLRDNVYILFLLSPLILIIGLDEIFIALNQALNRFKVNLILLISKHIINISVLLTFYLFLQGVPIEYIVYLNISTALIQALLDCIVILKYYFTIIKTSEESTKFKEFFTSTIKHGGYLGLGETIDKVWKEVQIQGIGTFTLPLMVTGYNIAIHYEDLTFNLVSGLYFPLTNSFSTLDLKNNYEQIERIFKITFKFSLFVIILVSGILFFFSDFFLDFVFGDVYVEFTLILKLYILTAVFKFFDPLFQSLMSSQNKVKTFTKLRIVNLVYTLPLFFIGLIFFGLIGAILLGCILGFFIRFVLEIILCIKIGNIRIKLKKFLILYLIFFISLGIVALLDVFFLKKLSYSILQNLNLTLFKNFNFISIIVYIFTFFILNYIFRVFSIEEIELLEQFFNKDNRFQRMIRKGLRFSKKIIRE